MESTARLALGGVMLALFLAECLWAWRARRHAYEVREVLCNVAIAFVNGLIKPLTLAWSLFLLNLVQPWRVVDLPTSGAVFLLTFLVTDFAYYWFHRLSHRWRPLWAIHQVHHSSPWMNLSTAIRLPWLGKAVTPLYFVPLALLGLPAPFIALSLGIGLLYQFPLHTQAIPKLGAFEGKLLNTPSAHRVHHGANAQYVDRNYAGFFILWDVLFGTYQAEREPVHYGVTTGFVSHNPLRVQWQPLVNYWRERRAPIASVDDGVRKVDGVAHV
ncbi:MAG: sterol desaturase family protein [Pseudomonadota bacterium]